MGRNRTHTNKADKPSEIQVEVLLNGKKEVLREPVPEGFPPELIPCLADYMERGFRAGLKASHLLDIPSLVEFAKIPGLGRPVNAENEREGREAAKLRKDGLTFGQIARQVCRYRSKPTHHCKKKCADRIRQTVKQYEERKYIESLERGE